MNTKTVLYVDDEPDIREIAEIALGLDPHLTVRTCSSGTEAIAQAVAWRPDLILLDVMMPGMDGPTTLRHLQSTPETASIPVVFITARTQTHEVNAFLALGAKGVIAKPFDPLALAEKAKGFIL